MSLELESAELSHLEELARLFDGYRQFYGQNSDEEGCRRFLRERQTAGDSVIWIARHEGQPAGFTQLYPSFTSVGMRRIWILNDLFVDPTARRHGVATALIQAAEQHARDTSAARLVLATAIDNVAAASLYEKLGWKLDEAFKHYVRTCV